MSATEDEGVGEEDVRVRDGAGVGVDKPVDEDPVAVTTDATRAAGLLAHEAKLLAVKARSRSAANMAAAPLPLAILLFEVFPAGSGTG